MLRNEPGWLLHNCAVIFHTFFFIFLALSTLSDAKSASFTNTVLNDGTTENIFTGTDPQVPLTKKVKSSYDYIIVGAGSAGSVLAARLSEDPSRTVLLVEAGPDDRGWPELTTPISGLSTFGTDLDWAYTTELDNKYSGLDRNRNILRGGKVLGGSSSINAMIYCRGSRNDFDRWAQYTGDETWDYRHVLSYFQKLENAQGSLKDSPYRGTSGPLTITQRTTVPFPDFFIRASEEAGYSRNCDYNGEKMSGSGYLQHTTLNGERMSASRAYLWPVLERSNLDVVVNTQVCHVIIKNGCAVGVQLIQGQGKGDSTTLTFNVEAKSEVILSAGAVGSPKLLMLSGVGQRNHLDSLGIHVVADLPVGENFQDHLFIDLSYKIDKPIGLNRLSLQDPKVLQEYLIKRSGPLSSPYGTESVLFTADSEYDRLKDWPTIQLIVVNVPSRSNVMKQQNYLKQSILELAGRDKITDGFMILATLLRPKSRGRITLKSKDPLDSPRIKTNYLSRVEDVDTLMESINVTQNVVNAMSLKYVGAAPTEDFTYTPCKRYRYNTREFWECQVRSRPLSIWHPVGTCKMGPRGDKTAVVNSQLRVQGIQSLRVVDASIMPWITSCNTNAPVIMIAEKAADIIKGVKPLAPTDIYKVN